MSFTEVLKDVYRFIDSVNVYAIKSENSAILIDFGSGDVLNHLSDIGVDNVEYIFHTHYHRDQCYGDLIALKKNIKIGAPDMEKKLFSEAEDFWKKNRIMIFIFLNQHFSLPHTISRWI